MNPIKMREVAVRELDGVANEQDVADLNEDIEGWDSALQSLDAYLLSKIQAAKLRVAETGMSVPAKVEYERVKAEVIPRRAKIVEKRRLLKDLLRDERNEASRGGRDDALDRIFEELRSIRSLIERRT